MEPARPALGRRPLRRRIRDFDRTSRATTPQRSVRDLPWLRRRILLHAAARGRAATECPSGRPPRRRTLTLAHGAPLRVVAPDHYGYKSCKHLAAVEFGDDSIRGVGLIQHPRGRVAAEERGRLLPGGLYPCSTAASC